MHRNAALTQCRAERMADVMEQRGITAAQAATALGYTGRPDPQREHPPS
ncbi:hypothetical protein [Streptomyces galbus]|nr:hypothetical protein [Streptomyces galbus]GHD29626.1 hypothetical protein GCM10010335_18780 [Streptomyces galbus]